MPFYSINNNPILPANFANQQGVYIIYALNTDMTPQPISRILGIDNNGILYIGETTNFKKRLELFRRVMSPANASIAHSGALNLKELPALRQRFPANCIYVKVFPHQNPNAEETRMIEEYRQEFGEVPPLNGSK